MQPQEFDKATEYAREMKRMAGISDINNIYKNDYKSDNRANNKHSTYNQGVKSIFTADSSSRNNNDFPLILALILLLSKDGGDKMLILALLYIML